MATKRVERLLKMHRDLTHARYRCYEKWTVLDDERIRTEPLMVRRARGLALLLRRMPIFIQEGELIVGSQTMSLWNRKLYEKCFSSYDGELYDVAFEEREKQILQDWINYFSSISFPHYALEEEKEEANSYGWFFLAEGAAINHLSPRFEIVLEKGLGGIRKEAEEKLRSLKDTPEDREKTIFLRSVLIVYEAATDHIMRYAREAEALASKETDIALRKELKETSRICRWIATKPPRNFQEALQLLWFTWYICHIEILDWVGIGRFDRYMYSYYKRDIEEGKITREEALELLECLWIKFNEATDLNSDNGRTMTLGGQTSDGQDEFTYLCLEASGELKLANPILYVRMNRNTPKELLEKVAELNIMRLSMPGIMNDEVIIPALEKMGIPPDDALDYCADGCWEPIVYGKSNNWSSFTWVNLLRCLEMALERLEEYKTFEELMDALKEQISRRVRETVESITPVDAYIARSGFLASPFTSALVEDCMEKMKDYNSGGARYCFTGMMGQALPNVADSLAAVKKLVFEDTMLTKNQLKTALNSNFEGGGGERIRQLLLNRAPKYGNDDDYVDLLAREVAEHFSREVKKYTNGRGGRFNPAIGTFGWFIDTGLETGATPDGRKVGEACAVNASPHPGRARKGATAAIKSYSKLPGLELSNGASLELKFTPTVLASSGGKEKLVSLYRAFIDLGGVYLNGLTVTDVKVLRDAQKHPDEYRDLTVRVWGVTA